ncbi:myosin-binding protein C, cardiac-type-like [Lepeophtheirus salmonis]|uniref:myosin-binding protein C, cardiac-type-like n=1 Tax=Lepeophtheirus salmonis TaxID=72036 RepID=UPI003AF3AEB0
MTIPYQVEGEKQSDLEIFVKKDGEIFKIGKDVQLTVHGDRIQLDVINPKREREKSGTYKVIMKNAQGSDETLINVNIMDVPTPPTNAYVDTVFQDNMTVHWGPPKDNGRTDSVKMPRDQKELIRWITLSNSRPIHYDLWFGGEPAPTVECLRDGHPTPTDKDTSIELYSKNGIYTEKNTVLSIPKADRDQDTGIYAIRLTCESGTFEASGKVNVLDVPLAPRSLQPDEVHAEHVKLSWQPPLDEGGTPITAYIVRYMGIDSGEGVTACA